MSMIKNSLDYYQSNQGLLSMLNKKKSGNPLIDQIITKNEMVYQRKMEAMGFGSNSKNNSKYKNVDKAASNLADAAGKLDDNELYAAKEGEEYDVTKLIKSVENYVTTFNTTMSNLSSCGGALEKSFKTEFIQAYKEKAEDFEKIGLSMGTDNKLVIDQDKLGEANPEDIKALLGKDSTYKKNVMESINSINTIIDKALAMSSGNYNSKGLMI